MALHDASRVGGFDACFSTGLAAISAGCSLQKLDCKKCAEPLFEQYRARSVTSHRLIRCATCGTHANYAVDSSIFANPLADLLMDSRAAKRVCQDKAVVCETVTGNDSCDVPFVTDSALVAEDEAPTANRDEI